METFEFYVKSVQDSTMKSETCGFSQFMDNHYGYLVEQDYDGRDLRDIVTAIEAVGAKTHW